MVKVSILRGKPDVKRALELIEFSPEECDVAAVKADLCTTYPGLEGPPMDVRILGQLLEYLEGVAKERIVVDSCSDGRSVLEVYERLGVKDVCNYYGAEVVDLNRDVRIPVRKDFKVLRNVKVPRSVLKADVFVNLALMKTDELTGVALSLRNLLDIIPGGASMFSAKMDEALCDALRIKKPDLSLVDGMVAVEGDRPKKMNLLLASADPVALDVVCCKVMGVNPGMIEYLVKAGFYNLGETLMQKIEVVGERIANVRERFIY
jgi:uncharacterized protein (DUF362 family)